jgi:hypothetical protein
MRCSTLLAVRHEGEVVGAAAWLPPGAYPIPPRRQLRQAVDLVPAAVAARSCLREVQRARPVNRAHHRGFPPHFYLRALGIAPSQKSKGYGSSVVRPVVALADAQGVGCFLQTATADNVAWYARFGFEVAATYRPTPTWPQVWNPWREPVDRVG